MDASINRGNVVGSKFWQDGVFAPVWRTFSLFSEEYFRSNNGSKIMIRTLRERSKAMNLAIGFRMGFCADERGTIVREAVLAHWSSDQKFLDGQRSRTSVRSIEPRPSREFLRRFENFSQESDRESAASDVVRKRCDFAKLQIILAYVFSDCNGVTKKTLLDDGRYPVSYSMIGSYWRDMDAHVRRSLESQILDKFECSSFTKILLSSWNWTNVGPEFFVFVV